MDIQRRGIALAPIAIAPVFRKRCMRDAKHVHGLHVKEGQRFMEAVRHVLDNL